MRFITLISVLTCLAAAPTYYRDVKPITDGRCVACHQTGGIAPFPLATFEDVWAHKEMVAIATRSRAMPPWHADSACAEYANDPSLSDVEINTLTAWAQADGPEGDHVAAPPVPPPGRGLSRVDVELAMSEPYSPTLFPDDYRCFVLAWPLPTASHLTGINLVAGNPSLVHHVITYLVPTTAAPDAERLDAADPKPGYQCFGDAGIPDAQWVGVWGPGTSGMDFPDGTGVAVDPGAKIVLQMHYNAHHGAHDDVAPDQSRVQFRVDAVVAKRAHLITYFDPNWTDNPQTMMIPAGQPDVMHRFSTDLARLYSGRDLDIHGAWHHMHLLGKSGRTTIDRADGRHECLLEVPKWNFHWQTVYWLRSPKRLQVGERLTLECRFDNSAGNQPIIDGEQQPPRDVTWGHGSRDEMCVSALYVTEADH